MRRALLMSMVLLVAAAPAQAADRYTRASAEDALEHVEEIVDDRGAGGRALTPALIDLARQRPELDTADQRRARSLLARPPEGTSPGAWSGPAAATEESSCTTHFCFHWVGDESFNDAPDPVNADGNDRPDFVDNVADAFEQSYATEVGTLQWRTPVSDGALGGGTGLVDVYISDIGPTYGYAVPETSARSTYGYLVVDDDYNASEFPEYGGDPAVPIQATAAHEFNHVLQYTYDAYQDLWMFESTATWAEDKVFDDANDYVFYLSSWAAEPDEPITSSGDGIRPPSSDDLKQYGSAIWNHWIDDRYGPEVVRDAWAKSPAASVFGIGFAPGAYDRAIKDEGGAGFSADLAEFTSATAEWDAADSGIREGSTFPFEVTRQGTLTANGAPATGIVDHTAFALYNVPVPSGATSLFLTGGLPAGTRGAIALVGTINGSQVRAVGPLDSDGRVSVSLSEPGRFSRITAAIVNTDSSVGGFSGGDWLWTRDNQFFSLSATTGAPPVEPTPTPTATPTVTPPPPPLPPPPATSVRLSRNSTRIGSVVRKGVLSLFARTNKAGRLSARGTVDAATAKRLKVGRRTTTAGTGRRSATAPARVKINVKLTRKVRAALKRETRRTVRIKVRVTFVPADGTAAVRRTLSVLLRP